MLIYKSKYTDTSVYLTYAQGCDAKLKSMADILIVPWNIPFAISTTSPIPLTSSSVLYNSFSLTSKGTCTSHNHLDILKVAYYSFDGLWHPDFWLFWNLFQDVFPVTIYCFAHVFHL